MTGRLAGKIAVITGTSGSQGRAAALLFAKEGAIVAGCGRDAGRSQETLDLVRKAGGQMMSRHPFDLADREAVKQWIDSVAAEHGGIDILYNNASAPRMGHIADMTAEDWHASIRDELDIIFYATQAAWPHLIARGGGSIISTAGICAYRALPLFDGCLVHSAGKAGVIGLTLELAREGAPHNIRANTVSPGFIRLAKYPLPPEFEAQIKERQMLQRLGEPVDMAYAALFLASDESTFITGTDLTIDGGYSAQAR